MNSEKKKTVNRTGLLNTLMWPVPTAGKYDPSLS